MKRVLHIGEMAIVAEPVHVAEDGEAKFDADRAQHIGELVNVTEDREAMIAVGRAQSIVELHGPSGEKEPEISTDLVEAIAEMSSETVIEECLDAELRSKIIRAASAPLRSRVVPAARGLLCVETALSRSAARRAARQARLRRRP